MNERDKAFMEKIQAELEKATYPFIGMPNTRATKEAMEVVINTRLEKTFPQVSAERGMLLGNIVIMRQFTENTNLSEEFLQELRNSAVEQIFSVDWLLDQYGNKGLEPYRGRQLQVVDAEIGTTYNPNGDIEKAVIARGMLLGEGVVRDIQIDNQTGTVHAAIELPFDLNRIKIDVGGTT